MMMNKENINNIERFSGFADLYDANRPQPPITVIDILINYLRREPNLVVDLGCGTGLSTCIWKDNAKKVIGIEPNGDMLAKARLKLKIRTDVNNLLFEQGVSHQLKLESNSVDIVTCSQSFHWMEPKSTVEEVSRVLVNGGVFAA
ncbi:class I SAM-dependent methyltransferase [Tepidibacillus marianensis]|uniref:class I SAM-dependent methyltransferase n=1 Tax=Tepidibacillus marianensis TaxID=3131995 RepID=UPI0030D5AF70